VVSTRRFDTVTDPDRAVGILFGGFAVILAVPIAAVLVTFST
jgi:hypothetical protein